METVEILICLEVYFQVCDAIFFLNTTETSQKNHKLKPGRIGREQPYKVSPQEALVTLEGGKVRVTSLWCRSMGAQSHEPFSSLRFLAQNEEKKIIYSHKLWKSGKYVIRTTQACTCKTSLTSCSIAVRKHWGVFVCLFWVFRLLIA